MTRRHRLEVGVKPLTRVGWHPDREGSNHQAATIDILQNALLVGQTFGCGAHFLRCADASQPEQPGPRRVLGAARRRVGANIVALRTDRGLTQEALALRSGISRNVLIDVERGRRGLLYERLFDLAEALDVSVAALLQEQRGASG